MSRNQDVVAEFVRSWGKRDIDRIMGFFRDDAVYINIPIDPPAQGKQAIRNVIAGFVGMAQEIEFVVHNTAENEAKGVVMNERTDRFRMGDKWVEARVMGVFELEGGKIRAWRDYFDLAEFQKQMAG
jgi:limonene-1,2-epoxide hydrolase